MSEAKIEKLPLKEVLDDADFNCRDRIAPIDVMDLANDIERQGLIQPVIVMALDEKRKKEHPDKKYLLIAGYRRFKAHKVKQLETIDSIVKTGLDEDAARIVNLTENTQRKELTILQEAKSIAKIRHLSETDIAAKLNVGRGWVQIRGMLLKLPEDIQSEVEQGYITQTQIRELYTILLNDGIDETYQAAKQFKEQKITGKREANVASKKKALKSKRQRKRPEIFVMMNHIQENFGGSLTTRGLAWCAGEITTGELYQELENYAAELGLPYDRPKDEEASE